MINEMIDGLQSLFDDLVISKGHNRSIRIIDAEENYIDESTTYIWIRLEGKNLEVVNFSNVILAESKRNQGRMTKIYEFMLSYPGVKEIHVTGISTPEMKSWCKKNKLKFINDGWTAIKIIEE